MKIENYCTLEFPSRSANEGFARAAAACFAAQLDPTLEEINDVKTAVSEAVTNAIVHAYPDRIGKIVMKLRRKEGQVLEIVVRDWGVGIADVTQARTPLFTTGSEAVSYTHLAGLSVGGGPGGGDGGRDRPAVPPARSGGRGPVYPLCGRRRERGLYYGPV